MNFTDIFIKRPVLATVVSLMILAIGLRALFSLPILQYPRTENAVVTVNTVYYGADADVVAGFITTPLENAIAQANGIDYMTSNSSTGVSTITVNLRLNYDATKALTEITAKVNSVLNQLPNGSQQPTLNIEVGQTISAMYIGFSSNVLNENSITDYLVRVVQPKLQAVEGVQTAEVLGGRNFAMRIWLDPAKLAAYKMTAAEVNQALAKNNYISGLGTTKGQMVQVSLVAGTDLRSLDEFRNLIVKQSKGAIVRLKDIANVTLGADNYDARVSFDGGRAVYMGIKVAPSANLLEVIDGIKKILPDIQSQLPQGLSSTIIYDSTKFVNSSIDEVVKTLIEAVLIVTLVVFAFIGSPRSMLIPTIAIPLSLIGAFVFMTVLGYSINLLTLLSLVLAIGLVVDDAIIVVENVNRHIEEGTKPFPAAIQAARELANPIIAMTIVLVAVYVPIGFQTGLTGALFSEFAFTLVGSVVISAVVALTLSPMLCSRMLKPHSHDRSGVEERMVDYVDRRFSRLSNWYERRLRGSLDYIPVTMVFALIILGSIYLLYSSCKVELAPQEDQGVVLAMSTPSPTATLNQKLLYADEVYKAAKSYPEIDHIFQVDLPGFSIAGMVLTPWNARDRIASDLQPLIQGNLNNISGIKVAAFQPSPLPGARGLPVQFVITTTHPFEQVYEVVQNFLKEAQASGKFIFVDSDLKYDLPQSKLKLNRDKVAQMGLTMNDVGSSLAAMLGGGYVNYFNFSGRSYKVIPQVQQMDRLNADQLKDYYVRSANGAMIPVSTIADIETKAVPQTLNHFQQMNAATIQGVMFPGVSLGEGVTYLQELAKQLLPEGYSVDFGGQTRQFMQESSGFATMFLFALIIIFLTLSAQYESFRDPFIILVSVPMSIAGALAFISIGIRGASINIYTQVGLVTLMGLISKHGILITEFANNLQEKGVPKHEAIIEAASIRLRPILMTTAAMVLGVMPLVFASGAGALARFNMGLVIASGISIGTLFTLFVVPAVYMLISADRSKEKKPEE